MELLLLKIIKKIIRIFKRLLLENPLSRRIRQYSYERYFVSAGGVNLFRGVFATFSDSIASAPATKPLGYNHPGPANMYQDRTRQIYAGDYPVIFWLQKILKSNDTVFDLGGHIGIAYYAYAKYIDYPSGLQWQVCDVPEVVLAGKRLAEENAVINLSFTSDYNAMNGHDILFAAGSLQYIETPVAKLIDSVESKPTHVIINLLPTHESKAYVTLQNIGTAYCPYQIINQLQLIESMAAVGYVCIDSWKNEEKSCCIPSYPEHSLSFYRGFYFRAHVEPDSSK